MASKFIEHIVDQLDHEELEEQLSSMELPHPKSEAWKYTSLRTLATEQYELVDTQKKIRELPPRFLAKYEINDKAHAIVFFNGQFVFSKGIKLESAYNEEAINETDDAFDALRKIDIEYHAKLTTSFDDSEEAIYVFHFVDGTTSLLVQDQLTFDIEKNVHVKIVETINITGLDNQLVNNKTTINLAKDATCEHYRIHNSNNRNAFIIDNQKITQKKQSHYRDFVFDIGHGKVRNNLQLDITETHCDNFLYGLYVLNEGEHVDNVSLINHFVEDCQSNQLYKGVLGGASTGIFSGKIIVHQDAQRTNAFQSNRNLLISDDATANSKPQLEIFADDVKCSHGATASQLDEDPLFYLRSRGISKDNAKAMLTYAFAAEIIQNIKIASVKAFIENAVSDKLNLDL